MRTFGIDEPTGCYDDIEATDAFVLWGSNMAEMHPILWTRVTDRRLSAPHVRVAVLSTFEHRSFDLADIGMVFKPQTDLYHAERHRQPHHQDRPGQQGFRRRAHRVQARPDRHRLRTAARASAAEEGDGRGQGQRLHRHELRRIRKVRLGLHAGEGGRDVRRAGEPAAKPRRALCRPQDQGGLVLDHGLQPAHPRRLVQQSRLQHPSADRKDLLSPATARSR